MPLPGAAANLVINMFGRNIGFIQSAKGVYGAIEKIQSGVKGMAESVGIDLRHGVTSPIEQINEGVTGLQMDFKRWGGLTGEVAGIKIPKAMDQAIISMMKTGAELSDVQEIMRGLAEKGVPDTGKAFMDLTTMVLDMVTALGIDKDEAIDLVGTLRTRLRMSEGDMKKFMSRSLAMAKAMNYPADVVIQRLPKVVSSVIENMEGLAPITKQIVEKYSSDINAIALFATQTLSKNSDEAAKFATDLFATTTEQAKSIRKTFVGFKSDLEEAFVKVGGTIQDVQGMIEAASEGPREMLFTLVKSYQVASKAGDEFLIKRLREALEETFGEDATAMILDYGDKLDDFVKIVKSGAKSIDKEYDKLLSAARGSLEYQVNVWEANKQGIKDFIQAAQLPYITGLYEILNKTVGKYSQILIDWVGGETGTGAHATVIGGMLTMGNVMVGTVIPSVFSGITKLGDLAFAIKNLSGLTEYWIKIQKGMSVVLDVFTAKLWKVIPAIYSMITAQIKLAGVSMAAFWWLIVLAAAVAAVIGAYKYFTRGAKKVTAPEITTGVTATPVQQEQQAVAQAEAYEDVTRTGEIQSALLNTSDEQLVRLRNIENLLREGFGTIRGRIGVDVSLKDEAVRLLDAKIKDRAGNIGMVELD